MKSFKKIFLSIGISALLMVPASPARADMFGGDVAVLVQILSNALQQLAQLQQILGNGKDSLGLLREVNEGLRDALNAIRVIAPYLDAGTYKEVKTPEEALRRIRELYGIIPMTQQAPAQSMRDRSAAEAIAMNSELYKYADEANEQSKEIIDYSRYVNPKGAARLTAQSLGILIGMQAQLLKSNSQMLKLMGENLAMNNQKDKTESLEFKTKYQELSDSLRALPKDTKLPRIQ